MDKYEKRCITCRKPLRGRKDKKFCNDSCRSVYHNEQPKIPDNKELIRSVNHLLLRNRMILEKLSGESMTQTQTRVDRMYVEGFQFGFHTHRLQSTNGDVYFFCYDIGYHLQEDGMVFISNNKEAVLLPLQYDKR